MTVAVDDGVLFDVLYLHLARSPSHSGCMNSVTPPSLKREDKDNQGPPAWGLKAQLERRSGTKKGDDQHSAASKIRASVTGPTLAKKIEQVHAARRSVAIALNLSGEEDVDDVCIRTFEAGALHLLIGMEARPGDHYYCCMYLYDNLHFCPILLRRTYTLLLLYLHYCLFRFPHTILILLRSKQNSIIPGWVEYKVPLSRTHGV